MSIKPISNLTMFLSALAFAGGVQAAIVDLTVDNSGTISDGTNSLTFEFNQQQPSGTGVLDSFLRIQSNGNQQGYNTTVANAGQLPFDELFGNFTRDLLFSELEVNNGEYLFVLDINEPANNQSLLSLDGLKFFSTTQPGQNSSSVDANGDANGIVGNLLWNMDALEDSFVLLDANRNGGPGSGISDMLLRVPESVFNGVALTDNIILWSRFGLQADTIPGSGSSAGFEEWAHITGLGGQPPAPEPEQPPIQPEPVPEPTAVWLLGLGLLGLVGFSRRQAKVL